MREFLGRRRRPVLASTCTSAAFTFSLHIVFVHSTVIGDLLGEKKGCYASSCQLLRPLRVYVGSSAVLLLLASRRAQHFGGA